MLKFFSTFEKISSTQKPLQSLLDYRSVYTCFEMGTVDWEMAEFLSGLSGLSGRKLPELKEVVTLGHKSLVKTNKKNFWVSYPGKILPPKKSRLYRVEARGALITLHWTRKGKSFEWNADSVSCDQKN